MTGPLEVRCAAGRPCIEVADRLVAADTVQYVEGDVDAASRLRETAARFAELHNYGQPTHLEEAS